MIKAWAFYRRSTDKQELSIEDQRKECHALAARMGLEIIQEFSPAKGYGSGLTIDRDSEFIEMVRKAEMGGHNVRYLLVYDVSRFGRLQPQRKIYWEEHLKRHGIQVIYAKDGFTNDGSLGDGLTQYVKHSEAHQFSVKLSELTLRGAKSHAALGRSTGGKPPYGYSRLLLDADGTVLRVLGKGEPKADTQRVTLIASPIEKPIVQWIFETYDKGQGLMLLANELNKRGVAGPRGRHWSRVQLHYLLRNRTYLGERTYNKRSYKGYRRGDKGSLFNPRDQWVVKEKAHEPIIDKELFDRVQSRFKARSSKPRGTYHKPYLLSGLAVCANCGYKMQGMPRKGNGHVYLTYTCSGYHRMGKAVCRSVSVSTEELEGLAMDSVRKLLSSSSWKASIKPLLSKSKMVEEHFGHKTESKAIDLQKELQAVSKQIENIIQAVTEGQHSPALLAKLHSLEGQRDAVRKSLIEAEAMIKAQESTESILEKIFGLANQFEELWKTCITAEERKEFLAAFIHQVSVYHSKEAIKATCYLYKIPQTQQTPSLRRFDNPLILGVNCGGRI
jgi:DNA invertase Pin-like site-specific DNA recombinase